MSWIDKLERKIGRYAIPRLDRYLVIGIIVGYVLQVVGSAVPVFSILLSYCEFDVYSILHGQIWRIVTWVLIPPTGLDIFAILFLVCVLMWGNSLEMILGTFRMNVLLLGGIILCDLGGFLIYAISYFVIGMGIPIYLTTYYILLSMLMAIAICMPDAQVRFWFILPMKMKWMLYFELAYMAYAIIRIFVSTKAALGTAFGIMTILVYCSQMVLPLINLALFFYFIRYHVSRKQKKRKAQFQAQFSEPRPGSGITKHKCAICGRTEKDDPNLTFRYCSKCAGNYEYCQEHLFTHTHIGTM